METGKNLQLTTALVNREVGGMGSGDFFEQTRKLWSTSRLCHEPIFWLTTWAHKSCRYGSLHLAKCDGDEHERTVTMDPEVASGLVVAMVVIRRSHSLWGFGIPVSLSCRLPFSLLACFYVCSLLPFFLQFILVLLFVFILFTRAFVLVLLMSFLPRFCPLLGRLYWTPCHVATCRWLLIPACSVLSDFFTTWAISATIEQGISRSQQLGVHPFISYISSHIKLSDLLISSSICLC